MLTFALKGAARLQMLAAWLLFAIFYGTFGMTEQTRCWCKLLITRVKHCPAKPLRGYNFFVSVRRQDHEAVIRAGHLSSRADQLFSALEQAQFPYFDGVIHLFIGGSEL